VAGVVVRQEAALSKYVAFLRAINVGGRTVRMEHLRREFESLGFSGVETFIASGNVIFQSRSQNERQLEAKIEKHLQKVLGYEVATFLRLPAELREIANQRPFRQADQNNAGHSLLVAFLSSPPSGEAAKNLMAFRSETDDFHLSDREVYWLCRTRISDSRFSGARLEKIVGMRATLRNMTTVRKLAGKCE